MTEPLARPIDPLSDPLAQAPLLRAARGRNVPHTPVWFMRQAGRSLPEYRQVREGIPMLEACRTPDLVTEITMQPVRRYGTDAAILFSDIVVPLQAVGVALDIKPGVGPVIERPVRSHADLDQLGVLEPEAVGFIVEAIGSLTRELGETPLIGFAGAPFTLASYLVEGGPSRNHEHTKALMYGAPDLWDELMRRLATMQATWLSIQISAGASAVQLFDSWVGALPAADYATYVMPHSAAVLRAVGEHAESLGRDVPRIHFGVGTGELLRLMGEAGADVVGVDFRVPLDEAAARVGPGRALQGNLDPALLFAPWEVVEERVRATLAAGRSASGHIFNLGHGVIPETDPDVLARVVALVHEVSAEG